MEILEIFVISSLAFATSFVVYLMVIYIRKRYYLKPKKMSPEAMLLLNNLVKTTDNIQKEMKGLNEKQHKIELKVVAIDEQLKVKTPYQCTKIIEIEALKEHNDDKELRMRIIEKNTVKHGVLFGFMASGS